MSGAAQHLGQPGSPCGQKTRGLSGRPSELSVLAPLWPRLCKSYQAVNQLGILLLTLSGPCGK